MKVLLSSGWGQLIDLECKKQDQLYMLVREVKNINVM